MTKAIKLNTDLDESLKKLKQDKDPVIADNNDDAGIKDKLNFVFDAVEEEINTEVTETNDELDEAPDTLDDDVIEVDPNEDLTSLADKLSKETNYKMGDILVEDESDDSKVEELAPVEEEDVEWIDEEVIGKDEDPYLDKLDYDSDNPYNDEDYD